MAANATPTGKLTAGGIGGFLLAGAMVLLFVSEAAGAGGGAGGAGILGLIAFLLVVGGGICHALGYFGMGNSLPGILAIVFGIAPVLAIVLPIVGGLTMLRISLLILFGSGGLLGILGGISLMGKESAGGLGKAGGIVSLIGGGCMAFTAVLTLIPDLAISLGGVASIISMVGLFGSAAGFALAGVTMLGQRNAA